jgi:ABC-type nitrate/sulfonate/bicarbonate transport system substrate-binding protein
MRFSLSARPLALILIALASLAASGCSDDATSGPGAPPTTAATVARPTPSGPPDKITFMLGFRPQANLPFVGGFVAEEKGFFAEENLDVDIQPSNGGQHLQLLVAGEVQFTTADAANIIQRAIDPGLPLVSIALIGQTGQQAWVTLEASGLNTVAAWKGKTVAYRNTVPPDLDAILEANGLTRDDVTLVDVKFDPPTLLTEGRVDVYPVFLSNEPDTIERTLGKPVQFFTAAQFGTPTLGLAYVSTQEYIAENPEIAARFLRAVLRGIDYASTHAEEAVSIVLKYAPEEEREHQLYILLAELNAARTPLTREMGFGWQTEEQWTALYDTLVKYKAVDGAKPLPDVFTTSVLEAAKE